MQWVIRWKTLLLTSEHKLTQKTHSLTSVDIQTCACIGGDDHKNVLSVFSWWKLAGGKGCYYHVPAALATQKEENKREDERQRQRECLSSVNFKVAAGTITL